MDAVIPAYLIAGVAIATLIFQQLRLRRDQPAEKARGAVELQQEITQAFRDANALHIEDVKAIAEGQRTIAEQARTITSQNGTIANLIVKIDGLPTMIAEQAAQLLVKEGFAEVLKQALVEAGVARKDQPTEAEKIPLTQLTPPTLLGDLAVEQAAKDLESANAVIAVPPNPPTP